MYTNQTINVVWENTLSEPFSARNGVKQGGVLSPILFGVYIDELIIRLKQSRFGCHIGDMFLGALAFADDLVLLSPTISGLTKLLEICSEFGREYNVSFNPTKSKWLSFLDADPSELVKLDGRVIEKVNRFTHLGNFVGTDALAHNIQRCISKLFSEVNIIMAEFGHAFSSERYKLFQSYATSFYGAQLWDFSNPEVDKLLTAWRKSVRHIWKLPYRTHNILLSEICDTRPFDVQLHLRFLRFMSKLFVSENTVVRRCCTIIQNGSRSAVGRSLNYLLFKYNINRDQFHYDNLPIHCLLQANVSSPELKADCAVIRELCKIRDGGMVSNLSHTEVTQIIEYLCV